MQELNKLFQTENCVVNVQLSIQDLSLQDRYCNLVYFTSALASLWWRSYGLPDEEDKQYTKYPFMLDGPDSFS